MDQMNSNMSPENNTQTTNGESKGPAVGIIIIVVLLILAAVYMFSQRGAEITDEQTEQLMDQSSSTEISDIEADIEATNLDDIDRELMDIEAELDSELEI